MATSVYFNNFASFQEQLLLEDLIVESIKIYGEDMYYIPRKLGKFDQLYTADDQSYFDQALIVEMYIKSVDGFTGDGSFMSKFGLEIRDQVIFSVAQRTFSSEVGSQTTLLRPREGDLVYFPLNNKCFQIKYVNKFEMFYQLGALQTWEMTCELFEYSDEVFNTGVPAIDVIQKKFSTNILDWTILTEQGFYLTDEDDNYLVSENYELDGMLPGVETDALKQGTPEYPDSGSNDFIDFSAQDPFSEGVV